MNRRVVSSKGVHLVIWVRQKVRLILVKNHVCGFFDTCRHFGEHTARSIRFMLNPLMALNNNYGQ